MIGAPTVRQFLAKVLQTALLLLTVFWLESSAQVRFVQITDPHLFDEEPDASNNRKALIASVKKINERVAAGISYQFVVITGDIGVEKIIKELHCRLQKASQKDKAKIEQEISREIGKGVGVLTGILSTSKVRLWLFVPGNNDLYKENPATIQYYNQFIAQLLTTLQRYGIEVRDLTPPDNSQSNFTKVVPYIYNNTYAFIGFNNASFKNNDENELLTRSKPKAGELTAAELKRIQEAYVAQVKDQLDPTKGGNFSYAYLFYHIPDVDDPYLISGNERNDTNLANKLGQRDKAIEQKVIAKSSRHSSWFVNNDVRQSWNSIFSSDQYGKLMAMFTGHLHDWKRETYENYHWLKSFSYPSATFSKLYICPPIATKLQLDQPDQARGFMDVNIDRQGRVLDEWGRDGAHIFWYNAAADSFDSGENEKEREWLNELALGRVYEEAGRFSDAEGAYRKASASHSVTTSGNATAWLQRTLEKQVSPLNRYIFTPGGFSLSYEGHGLLASASLLLILGAAWLVVKRWRRPFSTVHLLFYAFGFVVLAFLLWLAAKYLYETLPFPRHAILPTVIVLVTLSLLLLWSILSHQHKNVLIILPLADTTDGKLGATFPHILDKVRQDIIASLNHRVKGIYEPSIPVEKDISMTGQPVRLAEESTLADLVEAAVPGGFGKVASWLVRKATRPEFYLRGSLQSAGAELMIILTIESTVSKRKYTWPLRFAVADLALTEEDLAYEVLIYTIAPELYHAAS